MDEEDESDLEVVNWPECSWCDGEHEPEGDPAEWMDRVADEVGEKRVQKMEALEKPEGSTKKESATWHVYDWRKKPYQLGDGISVNEKVKSSCKRICFRSEEREMTFSHQRLQDMYWSSYPQYFCREPAK